MAITPARHFYDRLLDPATVAVFGASDRPGSAGQQVFANLRAAGYRGRLLAINPRHEQVQGEAAWPDLDHVDGTVDLAVVVSPARTVADVLRQCGRHNVPAALVLSADLTEGQDRTRQKIIAAAQKQGVRLLGPNAFGLIRPASGLHASRNRNPVRDGELALISQSGAMCAALLDWAESEGIGFSSVISLGACADASYGEVLEFLATDRRTRSVLLYLENVTEARALLTGLRVAARSRPVIVIKPGRHDKIRTSGLSRSGPMISSDDVFEAALERTGAVRAITVNQMFSAARLLAGKQRASGGRLAIIANACAPALMAADRAIDLGVDLVRLAPETLTRLTKNEQLAGDGNNPLILSPAAGPSDFSAALSAALAESTVDAAIVMATPQGDADLTAIARACAEQAMQQAKPVLGCWLGAASVAEARACFAQAGLPHFHTPEAAVEAFWQLAAYQRNQRLLLQVPGPLTDRKPAAADQAREILHAALAQGRDRLNAMECRAVLEAFHIPVTPLGRAKNRTEARALGERFGFPVVMKIDSSDVPSKSEIGGVRLGINSEQELDRAWQDMLDSLEHHAPQARLDGITVEPMHSSHFGRELMIGLLGDPVFGPVVCFGSGGNSSEVLRDRAVALPPLNEVIIDNMIQRTRVARTLARFRNMPAIDERALSRVLLRVSEMACELPEITELDINPLIADERGLVAVDVRISIAAVEPGPRYRHMAIHPYPADLVGTFELADGRELLIRPIRPEDAALEQAFVRNLSERSRYFRFLQHLRELSSAMLARFTQIDYDREMALIAISRPDSGEEIQVGVARYVLDPDGNSCEFALTVADDWQGLGLGHHLMQCLMRVARERGAERIYGEVLSENHHMLDLMQRLDFAIHSSPDDPELKSVERRLAD
ncbi:MAG: GNAT family N-acetyltransferase [Wenzhouxiangellaceae bacterium]